MKTVTISTSRDVAEKANRQIQMTLVEKGYVNIAKYVHLREVGGMWITQVTPEIVEIMGWTLHLDLDALLATQGYCL